MSAPPGVRLARDSEKEVASRILTDAFVDEDGLNYWLKQGAAKTRARRIFFDAAVRSKHLNGSPRDHQIGGTGQNPLFGDAYPPHMTVRATQSGASP